MFNTEQDLVDVLRSTMRCSIMAAHIFSVPKADNVVLTEVNLGYGIADLVVAGYKEAFIAKHDDPLDYISMSTLFYLEEKKTASYYEIFSSLCLRRSKLNAALEKLEETGYIKCDHDCWNVIKEYTNDMAYSCAIEAKLKNWKRALYQAYRYRWFSEKAFVCLPYHSASPAQKNIECFEDLGVGLLTITPDGMVDVVYDPGAHPPISPVMNGLLNELATGIAIRGR